MKTLILESTWIRPHLETSGEIALDLNRSQNIKFGWIGNNLEWNEFEIPFFLKLLGCSKEKRISNFLEILKSKKITIIENNENYNIKYIKKWSNRFSGDLKSLKKYYYKKQNLGMGVASSLITFFNDKNINIKKKISKVRKFLQASAIVYERAIKILEEEKPKKVITFNNRLGLSLPIVLACKNKKILVERHERGSSYKKYYLYKFDINDPKNFKNIYSDWKKIKNSQKKKIAHNFFKKKFNQTFLDEVNKNFTKTQTRNFLPKIPKNKKIITYYSSTEYENAAYINLKYNQMKAFNNFYKSFKRLKNIHLFIRIHPSLSTKDNKQWEKYSNNNVTVIKANSKVDTYALMKKSDIVCSYASRISIESAYLNIPTLSFLDFGWPKKIGILYGESSELIFSHLNKCLKNKIKFDLDKILSVGFFYSTYGNKYKYYKPKNINKGTFLGKNLEWKSKIIIILEKFGLKELYFNFKKNYNYVIIILSFFILLYTFYKSEIIWGGTNRNYYLTYYIFSFFLFIVSYFINFFISIRKYFFIIITSILISLYFFEFYLVKFVREYSNLKNLSRLEYFDKLKKDYKNLSIRIPSDYNENINLFNFSGISNSLTILCNENGYFAKYLSDRYGFNNNDDIWNEKKIDYLIIGDSFGIGECVNREENIASIINLNTKSKVLNLSYSGHGPLEEFAVLKEYWVIESNYVIWLFFEGNDISDFNNRKNNLILKKYLNDEEFKQNLIDKQILINNYYNEEYFRSLPINKVKNSLQFSFFNFIKLYETRNFFKIKLNKQKFDEKEFKIFMHLLNEYINKKNSKLIFVYLPDYMRYIKFSKYDDNLRKEIKKITKEFEITFIDIHQEVFLKSNTPLKFFALSTNAHYNKFGYEQIGNYISRFMKKLD